VVLFETVGTTSSAIIQLAQQLRSFEKVRVLILCDYADAHTVRFALRAGATGCLLKNSSDQDLLIALRCVARGERFLDSRLIDLIAFADPEDERDLSAYPSG
jgi:DNA-binding NarL/FixJ family response regulator